MKSNTKTCVKLVKINSTSFNQFLQTTVGFLQNPKVVLIFICVYGLK